jgi:hypothetical protein
MRLRFAVFASVLAAFAAVAAPGIANAAPRHNHGLTINATPNPIITGDAVLIYGQLNGADHAGQWIYLFHRVNPSPGFKLIGVTKTNSFGFYWFTRAENVVLTNRSWYATAPFLPGDIHSRTVHERVAAAVNISASATTTDTNTPVVFSGNVDPVGFHVGERVALQEQVGTTGNVWHTLKGGVIDSSSNYSISYRFRVQGTYTLRVEFPGDVRNTAAASSTVPLTVDQTQNPTFTINSSSPIISAGQSATISGVLYLPGPTATSPASPEPNVNVTLFGHTPGQPFTVLGYAYTAAMNGSYSFTVSPSNNTVYYVRTTFPPPPLRHTAELFEGVSDVVSLNASSPRALVGPTVTFTGNVTPDKAGHVIELQRLGKDGDFHTVALGVINGASAYRFVWRFGNQGTFTFRTMVPGDPLNLSGTSTPVTVTVMLPAVSALPTNTPSG